MKQPSLAAVPTLQHCQTFFADSFDIAKHFSRSEPENKCRSSASIVGFL